MFSEWLLLLSSNNARAVQQNGLALQFLADNLRENYEVHRGIPNPQPSILRAILLEMPLQSRNGDLKTAAL